jgi:hypothetical protein
MTEKERRGIVKRTERLGDERDGRGGGQRTVSGALSRVR